MSAASVAVMPAPAEAPRLTLLDIDMEISCLLDSIECIPEDMPGHLAEANEELSKLVALKLRKVDGISRMLTHFEHQAELASIEVKRLQARKARFEKRVERLETCVIFAMKSTDQKRIEGDTVSALLQKAQGKLEILNEDAVPDKFKTFTPTVEVTVDKAAIKAAIKAKEEVPGVRLLDGKEYLKWS